VNGYTAYMWIVPAKVHGRWNVTGLAAPVQIAFDQTYQKIIGKATSAGYTPNVADPLLEGNAIQFTLVDAGGRLVRLRGTVNGDAMEGTAQPAGGAEQRWSARRSG
jgi:hypothetical protein